MEDDFVFLPNGVSYMRILWGNVVGNFKLLFYGQTFHILQPCDDDGNDCGERILVHNI